MKTIIEMALETGAILITGDTPSQKSSQAMSAPENDKPFPLTALDLDPFEGDFGTNDDKVFSDKMVVGRKRYQCFHCHGPILVGDQHRYMASKFDDEFMTHRFCAACCEAMLVQMKAQHGWDDSENEEHLFAFESRNRMHSPSHIGAKP
jgi:hypothetical protein